MNPLLSSGGKLLSKIIQREVRGYRPYCNVNPDLLASVLRPADVLLVEGNQHMSVAIKYLTQSTWSHAAMFIGDYEGGAAHNPVKNALIEVDLDRGCHVLPLARYQELNVRICRPAALTPEDGEKVVRFMVDRIGLKYDLKNILDLLRYLIPTPPIPVRWRRRMISLGSGDPTRAICSSLIAQAFQSVQYPILPQIERYGRNGSGSSGYSADDIFQIRHHSLYAPRDFDLSPFFAVIKPTVEYGFDYSAIRWAQETGDIRNPQVTREISPQRG